MAYRGLTLLDTLSATTSPNSFRILSMACCAAVLVPVDNVNASRSEDNASVGLDW